MHLKNTYQNYGLISKLIHLVIAILIIGMLSIGFFMSDIGHIAVRIHKLTGLFILILGIFMVRWTFTNLKPAYPVTMARWAQIFAKVTQYSLILLILLMPLSGWIFSTAGGKPPHLYGLSLTMPGIPISPTIKAFFKESHKVMAWILIALVSVHILAALKHWLWDKDGIMQRMWKF